MAEGELQPLFVQLLSLSLRRDRLPLDDFEKQKHRKNLGLTAKQKFPSAARRRPWLFIYTCSSCFRSLLAREAEKPHSIDL
jgi:hypothetical protein